MGGVGFAQDVTLDFTKNSWKLPTTATKDAAEYTNGTYTIKFGASNAGHKFCNDGYLMFGKSGATLTLPTFDFDVEKIVVVGNSNASTSVKQNIYVGEMAVSTETTGAKGTNTYEINAEKQSAGSIYTLKITSKHNSQITAIKIYKKLLQRQSQHSVPPLTMRHSTLPKAMNSLNIQPIRQMHLATLLLEQ